MDVQAATGTLPSPVFVPPIPTPGDGGSSGSSSAPPPGVAPIGPAAIPAPPSNGSQSSGSQSDPTPGLALLPPSSTTTNGNGSEPDSNKAPTLPGDVAKLYNASAQDVSVSFRVARDADEVVTVFTDTQTGKVIVQFPSETLIALAQFFQKLNAQSDAAGAVVNQKV